MTVSLFGNTTPVLTPGRTVRQEFVATLSQTLFTLTLFTYTPGNNSLEVYVNGQLQKLTTDYTETSGTSFTLVEGAVAGDYVTAKGYM